MKDAVGNDIEIDLIAAYCKGNRLKIGRIRKINKKMVTLAKVGVKDSGAKVDLDFSYPADLVIIPTEQITITLMTLGSLRSKDRPVSWDQP